MGIATGHFEVIVDFNWSPVHISASNFWVFFRTLLKFWCFISWSIHEHMSSKIVV